jgi:hypothetical protein
MTGLNLHNRAIRVVAAGLLAAGIIAAPALSGSHAAPAAAAVDNRVGLVIQDSATSPATFQCVPVTPTMTGNDVLKAANHELAFDKSNFLTTIDKVPAKIAPFDAKHPKYWSYWQSAANGKWAYSNSGADKTHPKPGTVEGWFYFDGATYSPAPVTFAKVCPPQSATPLASGALPRAAKKSSSTGPIAGTVVVVIVLGALAALVITRSRRRRTH